MASVSTIMHPLTLSQCLEDIYPIFSSSEKDQFIVTMGDNDLGGEGRDLMTQTVYR